MSNPHEPILDEIQWRAPELAQSIGGIHTNSVLHYFAQSPFFDITSNNATLVTQATHNASMYHLIQTREAFEGRLRTMAGLEFMVSHAPGMPGEPGAVDSGIWVIRKQMRRKVQGALDEVTVLASYFVVGENVYMATSIANVIANRLLTSVYSLTKYFSTASSLPLFSPALGNIYIQPIPKPPASVPSSQLKAAGSKEGTPMPDSVSRSVQPALTGSLTTSSRASVLETRSLVESMGLTMRYGTEYVDDNPLVGEPGSFMLSSARGGASQARPQPPPAAAAKAPAPSSLSTEQRAVPIERTASSNPAGRQPSSTTASQLSSSVPAKRTERPGGDAGGAGSAAPPKAKRRKSKAAGTPSPS